MLGVILKNLITINKPESSDSAQIWGDQVSLIRIFVPKSQLSITIGRGFIGRSKLIKILIVLSRRM
jgi:hypothetical protein